MSNLLPLVPIEVCGQRRLVIDPSKRYATCDNGKVKKVAAMYIGVNGEAVKIWDKEHGFLVPVVRHPDEV